MSRLEENGDGRALVHFAFQFDLGVVDAGNVLDDGQTQPGATGGLTPAFIHPVEAFKYTGLRFLGDADAIVLDGQGAVTIPAAGGWRCRRGSGTVRPAGFGCPAPVHFRPDTSAKCTTAWR